MKRIAIVLIMLGCLLFAEEKAGTTKQFPSYQNDSYVFSQVFSKDYGRLVNVGANEIINFGLQATPYYFESEKEITVVYVQITNDTASVMKVLRFKKP